MSRHFPVQGLINYDFTDELYDDFQRDVSRKAYHGVADILQATFVVDSAVLLQPAALLRLAYQRLSIQL